MSENPKIKYYRSQESRKERQSYYRGVDRNKLYPTSFLEPISEETGCPNGGIPIQEIAFSKSPEASIIAGATTQCPLQFIKIKESCILNIYETEEKPDIDISHCEGDFDFLEEVRYRKPITVKKILTVQISPRFLQEISDEYENIKRMEYLKQCIANKLKEGKIYIDINKEEEEK